MVRIRWRDGVVRRPSYAFLRFDENGVSTRQWSSANDPRVKRFFWLNQNRLRFEVVDATLPSPATETKPANVGGGGEAVPLPADPPRPSLSGVSDADSVECESTGDAYPAVRPVAPDLDAEGDGHLGEGNLDRDQAPRSKKSKRWGKGDGRGSRKDD